MTETAAAIILSGGRGSRLGGADKAALTLSGSTFLDLLVTALGSDFTPLIVVGPTPTMPLSQPILSTRESPAGSGPLAGIAAGFQLIPPGTTWCAVIACDTPYGARAFPTLYAAAQKENADAYLAVDSSGHSQPLVALYRVAPVVRALAELSASNDLANQPVRRLISAIQTCGVAVDDLWTRDVDTPQDITALRQKTPTPTIRKNNDSLHR